MDLVAILYQIYRMVALDAPVRGVVGGPPIPPTRLFFTLLTQEALI